MNGKNLLDKVLLSPNVVAQYHQYVFDLVKSGVLNDIKDPSDIPDENAIVCLNGDLEIYIIVNGKKYSFFVPKDEWKWK